MASNSVIFVNGVMDILHAGHIKLLMECSRLAKETESSFVVALDTDIKVKADKGVNRPIYSYDERSMHIKAMFPEISFIVPFSTNIELEGLIKSFNPILVKGEVWKGNVVGAKYCKEVIYVPTDPRLLSTSEIINRIEKKHLKRIKEDFPGANL